MTMPREFTIPMSRSWKKSFRIMVAVGTLVIFPGGTDARDEGIVLVPENLATARERLERGDPTLRPALTALVAEADRLLGKVPPSVIDKAVLSPGGDRHDYFSVAPCWWPDPVQPKGRPYQWRDGRPNPGNRAGRIDPASFGRMTDSVETLALAYHFTNRERYAKKAAQFLRVWFLDPASRMNPHLRHADTVPGRPARLGNGIFEFRQLASLLDAVDLLRDSYAWPVEDQAVFKTWLTDFYDWLTTSEHGLAGRAMPNHHGSWCDLQAARLAVALGRSDAARAIVAHALNIRVGLQIQPDGSQPLELARANPLVCSITNVEALIRLGFLADDLGIEWWKRALPEGGGVAAALTYLAPFADPEIDWPAASVREGDRDHLRRLLAQAGRRVDVTESSATPSAFSTLSSTSARWHLLWP